MIFYYILGGAFAIIFIFVVIVRISCAVGSKVEDKRRFKKTFESGPFTKSENKKAYAEFLRSLKRKDSSHSYKSCKKALKKTFSAAKECQWYYVVDAIEPLYYFFSDWQEFVDNLLFFVDIFNVSIQEAYNIYKIAPLETDENCDNLLRTLNQLEKTLLKVRKFLQDKTGFFEGKKTDRSRSPFGEEKPFDIQASIAFLSDYENCLLIPLKKKIEEAKKTAKKVDRLANKDPGVFTTILAYSLIAVAKGLEAYQNADTSSSSSEEYTVKTDSVGNKYIADKFGNRVTTVDHSHVDGSYTGMDGKKYSKKD